LNAGGLMKPLKSRSGILFPNDNYFVRCLPSAPGSAVQAAALPTLRRR